MRRVAAPKAAARFEVACAGLELKRPVASAADPWSAVVVWAEEQLSTVVAGTSPVLALPAGSTTYYHQASVDGADVGGGGDNGGIRATASRKGNA